MVVKIPSKSTLDIYDIGNGINILGVDAAKKISGGIIFPDSFSQNVPFSKDTLRAYKGTHILFAYPGLSVNEICSLVSSYKGLGGEPLFAWQKWFRKEQFADKKEKPGWYLLQKFHIPLSVNKSFIQQKKIVSGDSDIPSACLLFYAMVAYFFQTSRRLFQNIYAQSSDFDDSGKLRICIGFFGENGPAISFFWDEWKSNFIGIAPVIKQIF